MEDYVERQLTELHYAAVDSHFPNKFITFVVAVLLCALLPYLHIGVFYMKIWARDKAPIDRYGCSCTCFDTIFRGGYENPGTVTYKHVYFNSTSTTLLIWLLTALFVLLFYESLRHLVGLLRSGVPLRRSMLFLYLVSLYPHYYSWWSFFMHYNEGELSTFFVHHLLFTLTQITTTTVVLNLCNGNSDLSSWKTAAIVTISVVHIVVRGMGQFGVKVVQGEGRTIQSVGDLGLMVPDLLHVAIPLREFCVHLRRQKLRLSDVCHREEVILMLVFISLGVVWGRLI